jgi:Asp-tRNA(Asn)/Glu-tRNA(Gln) amidotransferase B subunit
MAYATDEVAEIQEKVITEIQTGRSLRQVCGDEGMPNFRTVQRWIVSDGSFAVRYARARTAQADTLFDRMEAVEEAVSAGTMDSHAARVVLDSMRWRASKLAPKIYGDRLDVQVSDTRISISGALAAAQSRLVDVVDVTPRISASNVHDVHDDDADVS